MSLGEESKEIRDARTDKNGGMYGGFGCASMDRHGLCISDSAPSRVGWGRQWKSWVLAGFDIYVLDYSSLETFLSSTTISVRAPLLPFYPCAFH